MGLFDTSPFESLARSCALIQYHHQTEPCSCHAAFPSTWKDLRQPQIPFMKIRTVLSALLGMIATAFGRPVDPTAYKEAVRVACVGDSITYGMGASAGHSYPSQLQALLGENWDVGNFGVSGRTLLKKGDKPYWKERTYRKALDFQPNVVVILLGANDTKPENWVHFAEFRQDYLDLIESFRKLESKPEIFLCRPTPVPEPGNYGINDTNIREEIKVIDAIAAELKLDVIDLHAALEKFPQHFPDRVHPNDDGAAVMADTVARSIAGDRPTKKALTRLATLFRPHAVLQRDAAVPVWGVAESGTKITVEFAGQKLTTTAEKNRWQVTLKPMKASAKPQKLIVSGDRRLEVPDILIGDVWIASGQSNMERQLGPRKPQQDIIGWKEAAAAADYPLIRQYYVPLNESAEPLEDAEGAWSVCSPKTAGDFTAIGFFFARDLQPQVKVPIGLLFSAWGGTVAEAWTSPEACEKLGDVVLKSGKNQNAPSHLYNAMISPMTRFPVKGVIWYQGEANNGSPERYEGMFTGLIQDWRQQWKTELPFLFVQIAPFKDITPALRDAQLQTFLKVPKTGMAVTTDVGDAGDIHPANKGPVGQRLALAARAVAYGEKIESSGPIIHEIKADGESLLLGFSHAESGLKVAGEGELKGFTIAGADGVFVPAKAEIVGKVVKVSSESVKEPKIVRYGWDNVPDVNLANGAGLPASPFQSAL
jgi:sialate O-acetylesterase